MFCNHKCVRRLFLSTLLPALLLSPSATFATTAIYIDDDTLANQADAIVCGTVKRINSSRTNRGVYSFITLNVSDVLKGSIADDRITIRELGGITDSEEQRIYGAPQYTRGEEVCAFLQLDRDGYLRTLQMLLGKFSVTKDDVTGETIASRDLSDASVYEIKNGRVQAIERDARRNLRAFKKRLKALAQKRPGKRLRAKQAPATTGGSATSGYKFFNNVRWFMPDNGQVIRYYVDQAADSTGNASKFAPGDTLNAVKAAFRAWSDVPTASIELGVAGSAAATPNGFCDGTSKIIFNDPFNEVTDPSGCGGILAIGGYCASGATKSFNGSQYREIVEGDIIFNNGWKSCSFWNPTNVAEVLTHELGHTIGLAHSTDGSATMYSFAHFDGRGAGLMADDKAGVSVLYPDSANPQPPSTPTPPTTPTPPAGETGPYRINGIIKFEGTNVVVKNTTVTLISDGSGVNRSQITGSGGRYSFKSLPAGSYRVIPDAREGYRFEDAAGTVEGSDRNLTINLTARCEAPFRLDTKQKSCVR